MWYRHRTPAIFQKLYPSLIWHKPRGERAIYLTFDDGPIPEMTPLVLDILDQYQIKATFFCVGNNVKKHRAILQQVINADHQVGNHTQHHANGWQTSLGRYLKEVADCDLSLDHSTNSKPLPLLRPPYGKITPRQITQLKSSYRIVMWDVLSGDFDQSLSPEGCLQNTIKATKNGSIVIFHDNIKAKDNLTYALPRYIDHCLAQGFQFKTL